MSSTTAVLPRVRTHVSGRPRHRGRVLPGPPVSVLAAGGLAVLQAVALLAVGLTSLDAVWGDGLRPPGALVAVTLVALAGWVVLAAAGGASLVDGAGHRLVVSVAVGELVLLAVVAIGGVTAGGIQRITLGGSTVPLSALAVVAAAVPLGKLLLATTPAAGEWVALDRRPVRAPRPPAAYRRVRAATVLVIGLALVTLSLVTEPAAGGPSTTSTVDTAH